MLATSVANIKNRSQLVDYRPSLEASFQRFHGLRKRKEDCRAHDRPNKGSDLRSAVEGVTSALTCTAAIAAGIHVDLVRDKLVSVATGVHIVGLLRRALVALRAVVRVVNRAVVNAFRVDVVEIVVVVLAVLLEAAVVCRAICLWSAASVDALSAAIGALEILLHDEAVVVRAGLISIGAASAHGDAPVVFQAADNLWSNVHVGMLDTRHGCVWAAAINTVYQRNVVLHGLRLKVLDLDAFREERSLLVVHEFLGIDKREAGNEAGGAGEHSFLRSAALEDTKRRTGNLF